MISTASTMKAVVCDRPGSPDVLSMGEIDKPAVPDDGVLVRVHASSATRLTCSRCRALGISPGR